MKNSALLMLLSAFAVSACVAGGNQTDAMEEPNEPMAEELAEPSDGVMTNG